MSDMHFVILGMRSGACGLRVHCFYPSREGAEINGPGENVIVEAFSESRRRRRENLGAIPPRPRAPEPTWAKAAASLVTVSLAEDIIIV